MAKTEKTAAVSTRLSVRTVMLVFFGVAAVEIPLSAMTLEGRPLSVAFLGMARFIEGVLILGAALSQNPDLSILGLSWDRLLSGLQRGFLWSAGFGMAVFVAFFSCAAVGIDLFPFIRISLPVHGRHMILFFLVGGVVSPLTEELFFRGILYGFLRRWGAVPAVMISSLAFVLAHGTLTGFSLVVFAGGVLFAVAYEIEKTLIVPMTLHVLGNLTLFTITGLKG